MTDVVRYIVLWKISEVNIDLTGENCIMYTGKIDKCGSHSFATKDEAFTFLNKQNVLYGEAFRGHVLESKILFPE